jgi:hypothetical protein
MRGKQDDEQRLKSPGNSSSKNRLPASPAYHILPYAKTYANYCGRQEQTSQIQAQELTAFAGYRGKYPGWQRIDCVEEYYHGKRRG